LGIQLDGQELFYAHVHRRPTQSRWLNRSTWSARRAPPGARRADRREQLLAWFHLPNQKYERIRLLGSRQNRQGFM